MQSVVVITVKNTNIEKFKCANNGVHHGGMVLLKFLPSFSLNISLQWYKRDEKLLNARCSFESFTCKYPENNVFSGKMLKFHKKRKIQLFILYLLNVFKVIWRSTFSRWKNIFLFVDFYSTGEKGMYVRNIFLFFHSEKIFNKIKMFFKNKERKIFQQFFQE